MEIIDIDGKDGICLKCHMSLNAEEKKNRIPICAKCIMELVSIVKDNIGKDGIEEYSDDVSDFTDFVSSSARLMGLDNIVVVQTCFNIYMDGVRDAADESPTVARKIFSDARRFVDIELERLEYAGKDDLSENDDGKTRDIFEKMMGSISEMMKGCRDTHGGNDVVGSRDDEINSKNVDNIPGTDGTEKEGGKENKKEGKNGFKRIRVD